MSVDIFVNEVLARQEDRDWLLSDPKTMEDAALIAKYVVEGKIDVSNMAPGLLPVAVLAHMTQYVLQKNAARGISREITIETLRDVNVWMDGYYEETGVRGLGEFCWLQLHFTGDLFKLGRLQFRLEKAFPFIPEGTQMIEAHIARGGRLDPQECLDSMDAAEEFFSKHFPEHDAKYFSCHSWLLSQDLRELLDPQSNVLRFSDLWQHSVCDKDHSEQAIRHLFGITLKREDIDRFPQATSLQKKAKARMLAGQDINMGIGIRPMRSLQ